MPATFHTPVPTLQGWFRAAYRQFEPSPPTQRPVELLDAAGLRRTAASMSANSDIAIEDWDMLFRAALEVLAQLALHPAGAADSDARLQPPGTALNECLEALDHLRRSVPTCSATATRPQDGPPAS